MNQFQDVPMPVSDGYEMIVRAIQLMTMVEAATNDA